MSQSAPPAVVDETEESLIQTAQRAISECRWVVGECASKWTQRHARGRTDADFGLLVGLSGDQIYQRRRVWETFSDVRPQFASLKWSHFYSALNWDDASDCLQWADPAGGPISYLSGERAFVQDPSHFSMGAEGTRRSGFPSEAGESDPARMAALARELDPLGGDNYAPYHAGAIHPPTTEVAERPTQVEAITPEQLAKRLCSTIERCNKALSDEILEQLDKLPGKLLQRLLTATEELHEKLAALKA